jgi:dienelactone hydrolase
MRRAAVVALALVAVGCGGGGATTATVDVRTLPPNDDRGIERIDVGRGSASAVVYRPRNGARRPPGVLFLHGWGATDPVAYGRWIAHLVDAGNEVIYPRYQRNADSRPDEALRAAEAGFGAAVAAAPVRPRSLVVVGHSAGGALAADYAADPGVPRPRAVFAVFPGRRAASIDGEIPRARTPIPRGVRVVALGGARDTVVGTRWAREIGRSGRYVLVTDPLAADHAAPQRFDAHARRAFWAPLDRLIARARR